MKDSETSISSVQTEHTVYCPQAMPPNGGNPLLLSLGIPQIVKICILNYRLHFSVDPSEPSQYASMQKSFCFHITFFFFFPKPGESPTRNNSKTPKVAKLSTLVLGAARNQTVHMSSS